MGMQVSLRKEGAFADYTHCNLCPSETRTGIKANTVATSTTIDFDLSCIRLKVGGRIFSSDTALDSKATLGDGILSEAQLGEISTSRDLDLSRYNVDSSDFLCGCSPKHMSYLNWKLLTSNGMFNLNTWVNLDEVMTSLLVDQELRSTSIPILHALS